MIEYFPSKFSQQDCTYKQTNKQILSESKQVDSIPVMKLFPSYQVIVCLCNLGAGTVRTLSVLFCFVCMFLLASIPKSTVVRLPAEGEECTSLANLLPVLAGESQYSNSTEDLRIKAWEGPTAWPPIPNRPITETGNSEPQRKNMCSRIII